jgi:hypothetical protein
MSNNVSYQLFNKQLEESNKAMYYSCTPVDSKFLSTCVDSSESELAVEKAFQSQLNLSEYYKGTSVFSAVKTQFMDRTMENLRM